MSIRPLPLCIAASLTLVPLATPVGAQPLPPLTPAAPGPSPAQAPAQSPATTPAEAPPPGRVGRIASVSGAVSFHLAEATQWQVASANLPVTTGVAVWAAPGAEAALGLSSGNRAVIGPSTEFDVDLFDDEAFNATQPQGESCLHLQLVPAPDTYTVRTPRGIVTIATAGRYEVVSGDTEHPTTVTVLDGAATLTGIPTTAEVGAGQTLTITGDGAATPFATAIGPAVQSEFLRHCLAGQRPPAPRPAAAPAVISYMTGGEALYGVGDWSENAEYGPVWYPPVANYVPYRRGKWAYVAPWGWTWVDDAPWGFAPSHYGRWAEFSGRWGWVPGREWQPDRRPVYAPALVGFLGGAALGYGRAPSVGWAPLGPRDVYRPPYVVNERINQVLNQPTGANIQITNAPVTINRNAVTIVPAQVLANSGQVDRSFRQGSLPASLGPTAALQFRPQAAPTRATIGATQAVLRQVNPAGLTAPEAHVGQGPALNRFQQPGANFAREQGQAINPAAALGGAALGAAAGGLLRPQEPHGALPDLRQRGGPGPVGNAPPAIREDQRFRGGPPGPGAIARPQSPVTPAVVAPRGPGAIPSPDRGAPGPILDGRTFGGPSPQRAQPGPARPEPAADPRRGQAEPRLEQRPMSLQQPQSQPQLQFHPQREPEGRRDPVNPRPQLVAPPREQIVTPGQAVPAPYRPTPLQREPERDMGRQAPPPQEMRQAPPPQEMRQAPPPQEQRRQPAPEGRPQPQQPQGQRPGPPPERPDGRREHPER